MPKVFRKLNSKDRDLNLVQDNIDDAISDLANNPFITGVLLKEVELIAGQDNIISHKLGKKLIGWTLVRKRGLGDVYDVQDANSTPHLTLILRTSVNITVDIRVF